MAHAYLNFEAFADLCTVPRASLVAIEAQSPGFISRRLTTRSAELDAQLRKRYATPFPIASVAVDVLDYSDAVLDRQTGEWTTPPVPFDPPRSTIHAKCTIEVVNGWLAAIVAYDVMRKLGFSAGSDQDRMIADDAAAAWKAIAAAADSEHGLWDLPRQSSGDASAIVHSGPVVFSDGDPYAWIDAQARAARGVRGG